MGIMCVKGRGCLLVDGENGLEPVFVQAEQISARDSGPNRNQ